MNEVYTTHLPNLLQTFHQIYRIPCILNGGSSAEMKEEKRKITRLDTIQLKMAMDTHYLRARG
jgi:hypothetical protein